MTQKKVGAYKTHQHVHQDSRETDHRALLHCARLLKNARDAGAGDMKGYVEALRANQQLWTMFQVALCDPENQLPRGIKVTLLNLSRYVDRVSFRAVSEFMPQILTSLIDINRAIANGLAKKPPETQEAGQVQAAPIQTGPMNAPTAVMTSA